MFSNTDDSTSTNSAAPTLVIIVARTFCIRFASSSFFQFALSVSVAIGVHRPQYTHRIVLLPRGAWHLAQVAGFAVGISHPHYLVCPRLTGITFNVASACRPSNVI